MDSENLAFLWIVCYNGIIFGDTRTTLNQQVEGIFLSFFIESFLYAAIIKHKDLFSLNMSGMKKCLKNGNGM